MWKLSYARGKFFIYFIGKKIQHISLKYRGFVQIDNQAFPDFWVGKSMGDENSK
jgi:hypothetical protein